MRNSVLEELSSKRIADI